MHVELTDGMSCQQGRMMKKHIVTSFRHAAPNMALQLNPDYRTVLNYATQTVTATIVNAKDCRLLVQEHAAVV